MISIRDFSKEALLSLLQRAKQMKYEAPKDLLKGYLLASCFFEPSTRTRLSFEAAMKRLGGEVIGFTDIHSTSSEKGESLYDAMKIVGQYSDLIVLRHPCEGAARLAQEATKKPIINAGDGANEHPTQTLLDLFTIQECGATLDGLSIAFVGDLLHGRTVHSLALALSQFDTRLYFVSPETLALPETLCHTLRKAGVPFSYHRTMEEILDKVDILYMTRMQKERFISDEAYQNVKDHYRLTPALLKQAQAHLRILHPLPRVHEIAKEIDQTPHAYYFEQAENGLYVRQALLSTLLKKSSPS